MVEEPAGDDDVEALMNTLDPDEAPAVESENLRRIAQLVGARARVEHDLKDAVRAAHANGESWAQIALALGLSRRAARRLYAERNPRAG